MLGLAFHRDWQAPDSWFCSELCEAFLEQCGIKRFRTGQGALGVRRVTPQDSLKVL